MKLATVDEELDPDPVDPADVFARENWFVLRDRIGTSGTIHLSGSPDAENEDECYTGALIDGKGRRKVATGGTLEAVVLQLTGGVRRKVCARCGLNKPLDEYCRRGDLPDGREYRCKVCERLRVKSYALRKSAVAG